MNWEALQRSRWARLILWPASLVYGAAARARAWAYAERFLPQKRLDAAVVSVGNLTTGGVGKTPMVLWLAERFIAQGKRVAVLTRGYGGKQGSSDEVELLRSRLGERAVVAVGADRFAAANKVLAENPVDVFLLDDGFQHLQLARDVDILLMDTTRPLQGASLLPAGMLREPLTAMGRADVVVFTRVEEEAGIAAAVAKLQSYPVFTASTKLMGFRRLGSDGGLLSVTEIGSGPFLAFCGLGNPQQFFRGVGSWGLAVNGEETFPDHHRYSASDVERITSAARRSGARALVTTEKDAKNLAGVLVEGLAVYAAVIELAIAQEEEFLALVLGKIAERRGAAA